MNDETPIKLFTRNMINELTGQAATNKRLRTNYNVHETLDDIVQKLFVAAGLNSYFRAHRHPGKKEFAIVLRGLFDVILFDDEGRITKRVAVGPGTEIFSIEIATSIWHTWIPREAQSVFFEVKQGPYDPATAVEFAVWAPEEGSAKVNSFCHKLLYAHTGDLMA